MNDLTSCTPVLLGCTDTINNIAFDGCEYYCTLACKCEIVQLNHCHQVQCVLPTCREYDCLCYDWCDKCFWATAKGCPGKLFRLDCQMNEIDCISLCGLPCRGVPTGISYHCCHNTLLVCFTGAIVEVQKDGCPATPLYTCQAGWLLGILSLCPGTIVLVLRDAHCYVEILDADYHLLSSHKLAQTATPKALLFNPCHCPGALPRVEMLFFKQHAYPYLCSQPVTPGTLGYLPCPCNYKLCSGHCCDEPCHPRDACADALESIALMEAALSHILNAEGEKIQAVLAATDDIEQILCVNREVNKTLVNATHLEQVLYAKLSALTDGQLCRPPHGKPCDCPPDPPCPHHNHGGSC